MRSGISRLRTGQLTWFHHRDDQGWYHWWTHTKREFRWLHLSFLHGLWRYEQEIYRFTLYYRTVNTGKPRVGFETLILIWKPLIHPPRECWLWEVASRSGFYPTTREPEIYNESNTTSINTLTYIRPGGNLLKSPVSLAESFLDGFRRSAEF